MRVIRTIFFTIILIAVCFTSDVYGMELEEYDFSDIQKLMEKENVDFNFYEAAQELGTGDTSVVKQTFITSVEAIKNEFVFNRDVFLQIIGLAIAAALIGGFSNIFNNSQIGTTGFSIIYMLLMIVLMAGFMTVSQMAERLLELLIEFMKLLLPTYFMAVGMSGNVSGTLVFYEVMMVIITVTEWMFFRVFIPLVKIYVVITIVDHISKERVMTKISGLIKKFISWMLKTSIAVVTGVNLIEGMVVPAADSAAVTTLNRMTSVIPGIGSGGSALSGIAIGAGNMIKNTIGGAALVAIIVVAVVPALKIAVTSFMYQILSGVLQPVTDKRITECISVTGYGMEMIFKIILTSALLFIISIAVICMSTNSTYYGM